MSPSSRQHVGGQLAHIAQYGFGGKVIPTTPPKPPKPGRPLFGSKEHAVGRGIDGPPQDSLRPKAVERSAGRRKTVDPSPFHTQGKGALQRQLQQLRMDSASGLIPVDIHTLDGKEGNLAAEASGVAP